MSTLYATMENKSEIPFLRTRLFVQMFLQFAIWGAWAPVLFKHLLNIGFKDTEAGPIMGTGPLAIMVSPLIAGQLADRYFSTERFLAFSYAAAGVLLYLAAQVSGPNPNFWQMWGYCFGGMLLFGPTLGLGNSLCFHHLKDARADFPVIRLGGTLGWIASAFIVAFVINQFMQGVPESQRLKACLLVGAGIAFINAVYCLTLPHTPPSRAKGSAGGDSFALGKILKMLSDPSFALFSVIAFFLLMFATFYYFKNAEFFPTLGISDQWLGPTQTIGQAAEIFTMLALPMVYKSLGTKKTIALGLFAWALRFAIFSLGTPAWLVISAQALHGVCFAFAIAAAMIYFERICEPDVRGSMQSFLTWIAYGLGMFVGSMAMGKVADHFKEPKSPEAPTEMVLNWHSFWMVPAAGCFVLLIIFMIGFTARDDEAAKA